MPLTGGAPVKSEFSAEVVKQLKAADVTLRNFQWAATDDALYFEGVTQSVRNIWKIETDAKSLRWNIGPERLTTNAGDDTDVTISRDGKKLADATRTEHTRLWSLPFEAAAGRIKGEGQPITAPDVAAFHPDFFPDGQKLAYVAQQAGKQEIREKSLVNGQDRVLNVVDGQFFAYPRWSPDSKFLVYRRI